jgi:transposase
MSSVSELFLTTVLEQRVNITFCVKLGRTPTETYEMLKTVHGDEALSRNSVLEWFKRFKDKREDLQDDPRSGRLSTPRNADTIANVCEMATRDLRLTLRMISDELNINKETIRQIFHEDLRKRKISHTISRMSRSNGDSHHAKTSSRLVKTIPVLLIAL